MKKIVAESIKNFDFELVLCDHIYLAQYLPEGIEKKIPTIPNNEDNGFTYYKRLAESKSFFRSLLGKLEWKKMLRYEIKQYEKYSIHITTSDKEKNLILRYLQNAKVYVVKNGVDLEYFKPQLRTESTPSAVFSAWFKYYPNQEAATDFVDNIFPLVKKKFRISGFIS
jgi:glycosyltransferase involved in cell wall biosynthesis